MLAYSSSTSMQAQGVNSENSSFNPGSMPQPHTGINNCPKPPETTRLPFILSNEIIQPPQVYRSSAIQWLHTNRSKEILSLVEIRKYIEFRDTPHN